LQAIGIGIPGQPSTEILFFGRLQTRDTVGDHCLMEGVKVLYRETKLALARWSHVL
jgi:hypothetical protein